MAERPIRRTISNRAIHSDLSGAGVDGAVGRARRESGALGPASGSRTEMLLVATPRGASAVH